MMKAATAAAAGSSRSSSSHHSMKVSREARVHPSLAEVLRAATEPEEGMQHATGEAWDVKISETTKGF